LFQLIKETNKHYLFLATKPRVYNNSNKISEREKMLKQMLDKYIKQIEETLSKHPEQWFNYYYFWGEVKNKRH